KIALKLQRMAFQIWEENPDEKRITLAGIAGNGVFVAKELSRILQEISDIQVNLRTIEVDKQEHLQSIETVNWNLENETIVLVDDVTNSGKTLLYVMRPLLSFKLKKIMIAVLIDRTHKSFPVVPDIIGHSIATTLQDHIAVSCEKERLKAVHLM